MLIAPLFPKHEINRCNKAEEGCGVVPMKVLALKHEGGDDGEDRQGDNFLNHLQLHQ